jgi:hypothetical protein
MIPLVLLVNSGAFGGAWIPENLDDGHLANYFFLLAAIMFINQVSPPIAPSPHLVSFLTSSLLSFSSIGSPRVINIRQMLS